MRSLRRPVLEVRFIAGETAGDCATHTLHGRLPLRLRLGPIALLRGQRLRQRLHRAPWVHTLRPGVGQ